LASLRRVGFVQWRTPPGEKAREIRSSSPDTRSARGGAQAAFSGIGESLSTILDDFSRFIVAWKLCATMRAGDVTDTLELALAASGCGSARVVHRPPLLSDNGASYIAGDLARWLDGKGIAHIRGAPNHQDPTVEFSRYAAQRRSARGEGKPETFDFLGFSNCLEGLDQKAGAAMDRAAAFAAPRCAQLRAKLVGGQARVRA
jgi:Integrase core domain